MSAFPLVTSSTLREDYIRLKPSWLRENGLGQWHRTIYVHKKTHHWLIGLQKPQPREWGDQNDFILFYDGLYKYLSIERDGKNNRDSIMPHQIRLFLIDVSFQFQTVAYPTDDQILEGGKTETLEKLIDKIEKKGTSLRRAACSDGRPIIFMTKDFEPCTNEPQDFGFGFVESPSEPTTQRSFGDRLKRGGSTIKMQLRTGNQFEEFTVHGSAATVLETLEQANIAVESNH